MKRWIALAAAMYPRSWREQFGREFDALLDDVKPGWRVFANVLGGAVKMQMRTGTSWLKLVAATAVVGAVVSGAASFTIAPSYVSTAVLSVTPQPDPVRPTSPQALRQRVAAHLEEMQSRVLSRSSLAEMINNPALDLYPEDRRRIPMEDIEDAMRRNIRIEARSSGSGDLAPMVYSVSFSYPDRVRAQAAARALSYRLSGETLADNHGRATMYKEFWQDQVVAAHLAKAAPPPPVGEFAGILDTASFPKDSIGPSRIAFMAWGLGAGLLLGLLAALAIRFPSGAWQLGAFAVAGCLVAAAASFLIPNRYTATAVMEIAPAVLTEYPQAPLPRATPAAEFLRQMEPRVLSSESLSMVIQDPRLNLYPEARAAKPLEDIVREMRARDIRISPLDAASGVFSISFSYSDKQKTMKALNTLISRFIAEATSEQRANAARMSFTWREILSRRGNEHLEVIDLPTIPNSPETPNRPMIAAAGLGAGLFIGAITLFFRRPGGPVLQPA